MARITVQDCLEKMNNRFNLVLASALRARKLVSGSAEPCVPWEKDKAPVVALREVAAGCIAEDGAVINTADEDAEVVLGVASTLDSIVEDDNNAEADKD